MNGSYSNSIKTKKKAEIDLDLQLHLPLIQQFRHCYSEKRLKLQLAVGVLTL